MRQQICAERQGGCEEKRFGTGAASSPGAGVKATFSIEKGIGERASTAMPVWAWRGEGKKARGGVGEMWRARETGRVGRGKPWKERTCGSCATQTKSAR